MATELRLRGHSVSLWLLPCPFASGREREAASLLGVDKLEGPSGVARTDVLTKLVHKKDDGTGNFVDVDTINISDKGEGISKRLLKWRANTQSNLPGVITIWGSSGGTSPRVVERSGVFGVMGRW